MTMNQLNSPTHKIKGVGHTKTVRFYPFVSTGDCPPSWKSNQIFPLMGNNGKRPMLPRASSARHAAGMAHPREPQPFPYGTRPLGRNKFSRMSEKVRIFAPSNNKNKV